MNKAAFRPPFFAIVDVLWLKTIEDQAFEAKRHIERARAKEIADA